MANARALDKRRRRCGDVQRRCRLREPHDGVVSSRRLVSQHEVLRRGPPSARFERVGGPERSDASRRESTVPLHGSMLRMRYVRGSQRSLLHRVSFGSENVSHQRLDGQLDAHVLDVHVDAGRKDDGVQKVGRLSNFILQPASEHVHEKLRKMLALVSSAQREARVSTRTMLRMCKLRI